MEKALNAFTKILPNPEKRRLPTRWMVLFAAAVALLMAQAPAQAVVEIDINQGNIEPLPMAVTDFLADDDIGAKISGVITDDLRRSGLFAPINKAAFIQKIHDPNVVPRFEDWKVINAQALVVGRVNRESDGSAAR